MRPLGERESYRDASPALRRLAIDVDAWPAPPDGLFVVEEERKMIAANLRNGIVKSRHKKGPREKRPIVPAAQEPRRPPRRLGPAA